VVLGFNHQGSIKVFARLLTSYTHVDLLGAASVDLPQPAQCDLVQLGVVITLLEKCGVMA
jgi:hypothetical protein